MRLLSARLILSLILAITLVSVFSVYYQVRAERRRLRTEQQMIETQPSIMRPTIPHVVPERIHRLIRMKVADGVDPALRK